MLKDQAENWSKELITCHHSKTPQYWIHSWQRNPKTIHFVLTGAMFYQLKETKQ